ELIPHHVIYFDSPLLSRFLHSFRNTAGKQKRGLRHLIQEGFHIHVRHLIRPCDLPAAQKWDGRRHSISSFQRFFQCCRLPYPLPLCASAKPAGRDIASSFRKDLRQIHLPPVSSDHSDLIRICSQSVFSFFSSLYAQGKVPV